MNTISTDRRPAIPPIRPAGWLLAGLLAMLTACATVPVPAPPEAAEAAARIASEGAASPYRDLDTIPEGVIVHVPTGRETTFAQMMDVVADARVIYVGEMHNNLDDHEAQLAVLEALQERYPGGLMVGMEMFARDAQPTLDDWLAGRIDEEAFLTLWYRNWSEPYGYYRDILAFVRDHRIPLVALNATPEEVRAVSRGDAALPEDWDTDDPYHRAYLDAVMGGHGHGGAGRFYAVQTLWEETMARSAYEALTSPEGRGKRLVVLVGGGHIRYGFGIPRRLFGRLPASYATILPVVRDLPPERLDLRMDVDVPEFPLPIADFVWSTGFHDLEATRVKLGVRIVPEAGGMRVVEVMPGSASEAAGVRVDDLLVALDGRPLDGMVAVQVALTLATPGRAGALDVERDGRRLTLTGAYRPGGLAAAPEPAAAGRD